MLRKSPPLKKLEKVAKGPILTSITRKVPQDKIMMMHNQTPTKQINGKANGQSPDKSEHGSPADKRKLSVMKIMKDMIDKRKSPEKNYNPITKEVPLIYQQAAQRK